QRALMQFFKPENYVAVRRALLKAGRGDLIGSGCDALIPTTPPREAIVRRRQHANQPLAGDYVHTVPSVAPGKPAKRQSRHASGAGYRPQRKSTSAPRPRR
ncbi:MAG TPA: YgiQ family radical SAM protein, partial [Acidobacteria bacterium]|nr:YgiQ family radical SAM protein [Acidobacteriota bacterium]